MTTTGDRYRTVIDRVAEAAVRHGRRPEAVTVVVAAKGFGADAVRDVVARGARDVGENYVQEARQKARALEGTAIRWHMIGRLQRNKAKQAIALFDLVHSVDSTELAIALNAAAAKADTVARCLVEVNVGHEATKGGVTVDRLEALLESCASLSSLRVDGLMAIPPPGAASRECFARLRALRDRFGDLRLRNVQLKELSMGMSSDFEEAVAEGATIVRIGTAVFGPRP